MVHSIAYMAAPALLLAGCLGGGDQRPLLDRPSTQFWQGFGVEWDPTWWQDQSQGRGYDSAGWSLALARIDTLKPSFVRMMIHLRWFTEDPRLEKWNWGGSKARSVLAHLDALKARGIPVLVCEWGWAARPNSGERIFDHPLDPHHAEGIATVLRELVQTRGYTNIRWYSVGNEPESEMRRQHGAMVWEHLLADVDRRVRHDHLPVGRLSTEEGVGIGLTNPASRAMVRRSDVAGFHAYLEAGKLERLLEVRSLPKDMPMWLTEVGVPGGQTFGHPRIDSPEFGLETFSIGLAAMRRGASGVSAWILHDTYYPFAPETPMRWGLWTGSDEGWTLRPWAKAWTLLTRAVPPGSRISTTPGVPDRIRALDVERPDGSRMLLLANQDWDSLKVPIPPSHRGPWLEARYDRQTGRGGSLLLPENPVEVGATLVLPPYTAVALRRAAAAP